MITSVRNQTNPNYRKIYLKTEYAWYILDNPSEIYRPFYASFCIKHFVFHQLITSATSDRALTYSAFVQQLEDTQAPRGAAVDRLTVRDIESHATVSARILT